MTKEWIVQPSVGVEERGKFPEFPSMILQLLWNRGLRSEEAIKKFISPDWERDVHDPFLFRDMDRAVERLFRAVRDGERIVIHGDYDADGVCAATIIAATLAELGAKFEVFLPHRERDGYGLNSRSVERFVASGAKVIITCDCGIANTAEVAAAESAGINVIITDHHTLPEQLPSAYATIHPKVPGETYPFDGLAGGGVAFKLSQAIVQRAPEKFSPGFDKWLLDLAAISTVADMVPLIDENRTLVKYGLIVLAKTRRIGLKKLMTAAGLLDQSGVPRRSLTTRAISFALAPRINAAGRLNHANAAFALLTETNPEKAGRRAQELNTANVERQRIVEQCMVEARQVIAKNGWENDPAIVVSGDWPPGVVGLIASKLMDEYWRPVFAVSERERCLGSGRSIPEYHLVEAMKSFAEVFEKFGGHPQACGFTVKAGMVDALRENLKNHARQVLGNDSCRPTLAIDAEVALEAIDWEFYEKLRQFEPYGVGNPEPLFLARDLRLLEVIPVGAEGKHLKLTVADLSGRPRKMIAFGFGPQTADYGLQPGGRVDAVFSVGVNEWNGNRELQLKVVELRKST